MILGTILVHGILEVIYEMDFRRFFRRKVQLMILGGVVAICALTMKWIFWDMTVIFRLMTIFREL